MCALLGFIVIFAASAPAADSVAPRISNFDLQQRKASHWSWQHVTSQSPPEVKDAAWAKTPIDRFILAKLESKGLTPASPAGKRVLIRRAYFDLIGLPPKPREIDAFLNDSSPDAFAKVVEGLLASPHFGERWARHWMDLVRYAESYGHEFDYTIANAWQYRDYLIRAFNADVPYDQFVQEQVAGDLLPTPRRHSTEDYDESIIGTGFWWFGEQTHAPVDVRQHQANCIDNQIDVFGKTFLGLTISCARCHDHKFDAISQKDYYSLFGIVEGTRLQQASLDPHRTIEHAASELDALQHRGDLAMRECLPASQESGQEFARYLLATRQVIAGQLPTAKAAAESNLDPARLERWILALSEEPSRNPAHPMYGWVGAMIDPNDNAIPRRREMALANRDKFADKAQETATQSVVFKDFADGTYAGWYASGSAFGAGPTQAGQWDRSARAPRFTLPGLARSGSLSGHLRGVLRSGTFVITKPEIFYHIKGQGRVHLAIDGYQMDRFSGLLFSGALFDVKTEGKFIWHRQAKDVSRYVGHTAYIELIDEGDGSLAVDQIRFADADAPLPAPLPSPLASAILGNPTLMTPAAVASAYGSAWVQAAERTRTGTVDGDQCALLNWAFEHHLMDCTPSTESELAEIGRQMDAVEKNLAPSLECPAAADGSGIDEHLFVRGNYKNLGEPAPRRFLEAIAGADQPAMSNQSSGRLELARRMTDPTSDPFITRVMVNRIWHYLLGRGIASSTDNFGVLGSPPSHPELLDYLAGQFVRDGWSIKKTIRSIMLSRTYQMDSRPSDPAFDQTDPDNVLLHRANLRRLEAEEIRDEILSASGRLEDRMFGPPVNVFLTAFMEGRGRPATGPLDGDGRRSIYLGERRNFLSPMMLAFDQPIPFSSMGRRSISNVPAQALILMNDPFVVDQARLWASRVLSSDGSDVKKHITRMYLTAFGREPGQEEVDVATAFLHTQAVERNIPNARLDTEVDLWTDLAHALMNVKEFIFLR